MFTLFLDDSGTRPTHKIALATGLIVPSTQISRLEKEWKALSEKEDFDCFHASPCNAQDGDFSDWPAEKVDRVFARVRQISMKYGVAAISTSVDKRHYDQEVPAEYKKYTGRHHYTFCVSYAIAFAEKWRRNPSRGIASSFEFVFDHMELNDPGRKEIEKVMAYSERAIREEGRRDEYTKYSFRDREDFPGLQCVDGIAWACNCFARHRLYEQAIPNRAEVSWKLFGGPLGAQGWLRAFTLTREALRTMFAKEQQDGRTIARFQRWEKEDDHRKIANRD